MNDLKDVPEVPITLPPPRFSNPFKGLKGDPTAATVNCLIPKEVFNRVKQCRLEGGTIQTSMNLLWIKLVELLDRKGIQSYAEVREFEDAVKRSVLVMPEELGGDKVPRGPTPQVDTSANVGDDVRAVEPIRSAAQGQQEQPNVPLAASESSTRGSKGKSKRGKGKG